MTNYQTSIARKPDELAEVDTLLATRFQSAFHVSVARASLHAVALHEKRIIATVGIEESTSKQLPLERYFTIDDPRFEVIRGETVVEFTRWVSISHKAGAFAILAAAEYLLSRGKQYAVFSMKEKQIQYLKRIKLPYTVLNACLREHIPPELRPYYVTLPLPIVLMAAAVDIETIFRKIVTR